MFCAATLCGQQDVGSTAVAQADHLPPAQEVHLFRHNGALAVPRSQAVTTVQPKHIHLECGERRDKQENMHCGSVISRAEQGRPSQPSR